MFPDGKRTRGTAFPRFEVAMQSDFQEKFSHTMAVWDLLNEGSAMVCRKRAFAMACQVGRDGVSVAADPAANNRTLAVEIPKYRSSPAKHLR